MVVNATNIRHYGDLDFCEYIELVRLGRDDSSFEFGHKRYVFRDKTVIKKEFIKVRIKYLNHKLIILLFVISILCRDNSELLKLRECLFTGFYQCN